MTDTIQPALTPEEWDEQSWNRETRHALYAYYRGAEITRAGSLVIKATSDEDGLEHRIELIDCADIIAIAALANHALPDGHPLKITRADVHALQYVAEMREMRDEQERSIIADLAAKLAAILPPE